MFLDRFKFNDNGRRMPQIVSSSPPGWPGCLDLQGLLQFLGLNGDLDQTGKHFLQGENKVAVQQHDSSFNLMKASMGSRSSIFSHLSSIDPCWPGRSDPPGC